MKRVHIALLRGINVGGKNRLAMADLAEAFRREGCSQVRTYIQSGNVLFEVEEQIAGDLPARISAAIEKEFKLHVPVVVRSASELENIVRCNPFCASGADEGQLHVGFLASQPEPFRIAELDAFRSPPDEFVVLGREIYLRLPNGVARSKLTNAYFDSRLATVTTIRNWKTTCRLLEMARERGGQGE